MERAAEWFVLLTAPVVGLSHVIHRRAWAEAFAALARLGRPGAFVNGGLSLFPGAALAAAHPVWSGAGVVVTLLGWALVVKGAVCFLAPDAALRSMRAAGDRSGAGFAPAGVAAVLVAAAAGYALWVG